MPNSTGLRGFGLLQGNIYATAVSRKQSVTAPGHHEGRLHLKVQQNRRRLLATTIIAGASALAFAAPAMAQDGEPTSIDDVVVTGSRIVRQDYVANSPISTVTSEQIQARGDVNVEQILNQLPQVVPGLSANSNNPSCQPYPGAG